MIVALLLTLLARADDLPVKSSVSSVTVYLDRARVTRQVQVEVPAGRTDLVFDGLPISLVPASLAAEGEGSAGATLTGIDIRPQRGVEDRDAKVAALNKERRGYEDRVRLHQDTIARVQADVAFVQSLHAQATPQLEDGLFLAEDASTQVATLSRQVGTELVSLYREQRAAEQEIRAVQREMERVDREVALLQGGSGPDTMRVAVGVDATKAGRVTVRLVYVVGGAGWSPHYDARYDIKTGKIRLDLSGEVRQATGEAWEGVNLLLSTARPQEGTAPPELQPFYLYEGYSAAPTTGATDRVTAVEFLAPTDEDVASDGTVRRVYLKTIDLDGKVVHQVVARRLEAAWLTARVTNTAEFALVAGSVSSYMGTAYIGEGALPLTAPGDELSLSFGVDDRVRVERIRLEQLASDAKALGNRERAKYGWKTTITNHTGRPIELKVSDQVPVSREAAFQVDTETTPPVTIPEGTGLFTWDATLADGKSQDFVIRYEVSWPQNDAPIMME